ncbi:hypothetical protein DAPPUDRAFT_68170, partial [Daphnia pulex]
VDVLYRPEYLFQPGTEARKKCDNGGFIRRLIKHTERLLEDKEGKLCIKVLNTLRQVMNFDGDALRKNILVRYFAKPASHSGVGQSSSLTTHGPGGRLLSRDEMCLPEVQVYLDREVASDLVAELVMKSSLSPNVFMGAVQLGIALLEGGNPVIQRSLYTK